MKITTVVIVEVALLLGVLASIFLVPRNLPVSTFVLIAISVVFAANIFFVWPRATTTFREKISNDPSCLSRIGVAGCFLDSAIVVALGLSSFKKTVSLDHAEKEKEPE